MTYKNIQSIYKKQYGKTVKSCWIADVKRELKITTRKSHNRINKDKIKYPCPEGKVKKDLTRIIKTCYNTVYN